MSHPTKQPKKVRRQRPDQRCLTLDDLTWANLWRLALRRNSGNKSATVAELINEAAGR